MAIKKTEVGLMYNKGNVYSKIDAYLNRKVIFADRVFSITKINGGGKTRCFSINVSDSPEPIALNGEDEVSRFVDSLKEYTELEYQETLIDIKNVHSIVNEFIGRKCVWGVHLLNIQSCKIVNGVFVITANNGERVIRKPITQALRFARALEPYDKQEIHPADENKIRLISDDDYEQIKIMEEQQRIISSGHFDIPKESVNGCTGGDGKPAQPSINYHRLLAYGSRNNNSVVLPDVIKRPTALEIALAREVVNNHPHNKALVNS